MSPEKRAAHSRRVLVVDDNHDAKSALGMLFQLAGYHVKAAGDGLEAIQIAEAFRPRAIFMDLGMPRMDGYDAARYIRQQSWGAEILLVAVSGWNQLQDRRETHEAGFNMHLAKPVRLDELLAILEPGAKRE